MSNRMKKLLSLLAVAVMAVSVFAGCGNTDDKESSVTSGSEVVEGSTEEVVEEFSYPFDPPVSLYVNYGGAWDAEGVLNGGIGVLSKATGVNIGSTSVDANSASENFMLMLIDNNLPDILINQFNSTYDGGPSQAIADGYIIDLNQYPQYMPNYLAWLEENPDIKEQVTTEKGEIWCFPTIEDQSYPADDGIVYRRDILDALGMEVPTTLDEFYAVLKAVKENYPDMIPFCYEMRWNYTQYMMQFISNAFECAYPYYSTDGSTVEFALYDDNFKAFLQTINKWYNEGLLDPDFATVSKGECRGKMANGKAFATIQSAIYTDAVVSACEIDGAVFEGLATLTAEEGGVKYLYDKSGYRTIAEAANFSVTTQCSNIEAAMRYCDYMFSEEGAAVKNFGTKGVSWDYDADGNVVIPEAFFTQKRSPDEIRSGYVQGENWVGYFYGKDLYKVNEEKEFLAVYNADLVYAGVDAGMNPEESKVYSKYFSDLQTYCEEKITGLILGTLSFDDWDKIVDNAKNQYHADEILAAKQSAYTRYKQQ